MSVQEADILSSQPIPKRQKFEPDKHLFVCFMPAVFPLNPMWYAVKSVSLSHLSGGSSEHDNRLQDVVEWSDATLPYAMGFCCAGDIFYAVGGVIYGGKCFDFPDQNSMVRELRFTHLPLGGKSYLHSGTRSSMKWGKFSPIVVEIGGRIYALSQPPVLVSGLHETLFEVYDPSKNEWTSLDGPPFLSPCTGSGYSYVVIDKKLCVSSADGSCAFDTENRRWEACDLFADFYDSDIMSSEEKYSFMESLEYEHYLGDVGPPFPFVQDAVIYEDFLLCNVPYFSPPVVAFEIIRGKVARRLTLLDNSIQPRANSHFVDLGGGDLCLVSQADERDECPEELTVVKFKVWKGEDGGLGCADVMESTLKFSAPGRCETIYVFAM